MRIKKTSQYIEGGASLSNVYGNSNENGYTQEYINGLNIYSTDEVRVGTWLDKPLYRKVVTGTITTRSTEVVVALNTSIDKVRIVEGTLFATTTGIAFDANYYASSNSSTLARINNNTASSNPNTLTILQNVTGGNVEYNITIEYTKTTDTTQNNTRSISSNDEVEEDNR